MTRNLDRFSTGRLRAERLSADDFAEIRRMHQDPLTMAELGGVQSEPKSLAYFERNLRHWDEHGFGLWIVYEAGGTEAIGRAVLRHVLVDGHDEIETGYAFYPAYWGRGYASEVTEACVRISVDDLAVESIVALTTRGNERSKRVLARTGFALDRVSTVDGTEMLVFRRSRIPTSD